MTAHSIKYDRWAEIDGEDGLIAVPFDDVFTANRCSYTPTPGDVRRFYSGKIRSVRVVDGFGVYRTEWRVFATLDEANAYLEDK